MFGRMELQTQGHQALMGDDPIAVMAGVEASKLPDLLTQSMQVPAAAPQRHLRHANIGAVPEFVG